MASLSQVTQSGIEVEIDGAKHTFARITLYDLGDIEESRKAKARQKAESDGKALGLSTYDIWNVLADIDAHEMTVPDWVAYSKTPRGAQAVLGRALAKQGVTGDAAKELIAKFDADDAVELAGAVLVHNKYRLQFDEAARRAAADAVKNAGGASDTPTVASPDSAVAAGSTSIAAGSTSTPSPTAATTASDDEPKGFGD